MTITLKMRNSSEFPVSASWKIRGIRYEEVYVSRDAAIGHLSGRYGKIRVIDKTGCGRSSGVT